MGGQISITLDNVTERWDLCENLGFQMVIYFMIVKVSICSIIDVLYIL